MANAPGGILGQLIARAESGKAGYNAYNRGMAGDSHGAIIDFSTMTVGEIMARQALPRGDDDRLFAVGKYQLIPVTMKSAVGALGIHTDSDFTPALQERLFREYLIGMKRPAIKAYITADEPSDGMLTAAQLALALEFASVADPNTGNSHYGGSGGNKALISADETANALEEERSAYRTSITAGETADEAWNVLSMVRAVA
jgi:hypothetical protein